MVFFKALNEMEVTNDTDFSENTLICGDCLNVIKYIPEKKIDYIITDLPYG